MTPDGGLLVTARIIVGKGFELLSDVRDTKKKKILYVSVLRVAG